MTGADAPACEQSFDVPLEHVETELTRQMMALEGNPDTPVHRACMSNLVILCDGPEQAAEVSAQVPEIVAAHPARVLLAIREDSASTTDDSPSIKASVLVRRLSTGRHEHNYSEQVTLRAAGAAVGKLPFAVRALLIGDLPINLWWRSQIPPPLDGQLLFDLAENAQQIIYDSLGWLEPARAVAATSSWLSQFEQGLRGGRWRVASDLNWRRLKFWRRIIKQASDESAAPGAVATATELLLEHGPHAVVQAWELVSWLTSQLGWEVQAGKVEVGQEIAWQFQAEHGSVKVRIRRLAEGPAEVLRLQLKCSRAGTPGAVIIRLEGSRRFVLEHEGTPISPITANVQPQTTAELLGRQLSDRERDPVFTQSMAVAQMLAKSVLD